MRTALPFPGSPTHPLAVPCLLPRREGHAIESGLSGASWPNAHVHGAPWCCSFTPTDTRLRPAGCTAAGVCLSVLHCRLSSDSYCIHAARYRQLVAVQQPGRGIPKIALALCLLCSTRARRGAAHDPVWPVLPGQSPREAQAPLASQAASVRGLRKQCLRGTPLDRHEFHELFTPLGKGAAPCARCWIRGMTTSTTFL